MPCQVTRERTCARLAIGRVRPAAKTAWAALRLSHEASALIKSPISRNARIAPGSI
jgi:hypothetical protein